MKRTWMEHARAAKNPSRIGSKGTTRETTATVKENQNPCAQSGPQSADPTRNGVIEPMSRSEKLDDAISTPKEGGITNLTKISSR
jgi:hypothetical protein